MAAFKRTIDGTVIRPTFNWFFSVSDRPGSDTVSLSQKRSFLREPDEQYPISPQYPCPVLKFPSQIQIIKTSSIMSFDKMES